MQVKSKKAQSSVEALMILGVAMLFIIPLIIIFYSTTSLKIETLNFMQAKALAQHISDAAGQVWYEGPGARKTILVNYPSGMKDIYLSGDSIPCGSSDAVCLAMHKGGRDIVLTFSTDTGKDAQVVFRSPAPLRNDFMITGKFEPTQNISAPVSDAGIISPGLVVLVVKNEGQFVNVVKYDPNINY